MTSRRRDPNAKRSAILATAAKAFANDGFAATASESIATDAGVSEGIVFHHFGSKHGLLEATVAEEIGGFVSELTDTPIDWADVMDRTLRWVRSHRMITRLWAEGDDRVIGSLRRGMERGVVPRFTDALRAEQEADRCRPGDPHLLARLQFAAVGEILLVHLDGDTPLTHDDAVAEGARVLRAIVAP